MPRQVPFTEYEAALLLDAYLKTLSGEKERMESVRDCSLQLRQMALNAGSEIDDIYRNVNGISFQMASMESAYQGHTIMKPATRLFTEIVFLYRNDAARYRQLLKEAKGMASAKIDNEAVFMAWLAQNASGVQLSELYLAFKEIEQQAMTAFISHLNSRLRNRKLRNAIKHLARCWANRSVGWCSRSSTQRIALRRIPPSTALSPDLNWRGSCP